MVPISSQWGTAFSSYNRLFKSLQIGFSACIAVSLRLLYSEIQGIPKLWLYIVWLKYHGHLVIVLVVDSF